MHRILNLLGLSIHNIVLQLIHLVKQKRLSSAKGKIDLKKIHSTREKKQNIKMQITRLKRKQ